MFLKVQHDGFICDWCYQTTEDVPVASAHSSGISEHGWGSPWLPPASSFVPRGLIRPARPTRVRSSFPTIRMKTGPVDQAAGLPPTRSCSLMRCGPSLTGEAGNTDDIISAPKPCISYPEIQRHEGSIPGFIKTMEVQPHLYQRTRDTSGASHVSADSQVSVPSCLGINLLTKPGKGARCHRPPRFSSVRTPLPPLWGQARLVEETSDLLQEPLSLLSALRPPSGTGCLPSSPADPFLIPPGLSGVAHGRCPRRAASAWSPDQDVRWQRGRRPETRLSPSPATLWVGLSVPEAPV